MESKSVEYLQKFGYRKYKGKRLGGWYRILSMMIFEVRSTWSKSTFGKVLLIIITFSNVVAVIFSAQINKSFQGYITYTDEELLNSLRTLVANYLTISSTPILANTGNMVFSFGINQGLLLIALFSIAGSGMFADDKQGKVVEIYMSKLDRNYYVIGKVLGIVVYINIFLVSPLIILTFIQAQSLGIAQTSIVSIYFGIVVFSLLFSLIIGLSILCLSISLEKRNYVSISFFLIYMIGVIFGAVLYGNEPNNEFFLLISPDFFFVLLAFVSMGDFNLGIFKSETGNIEELNLADGVGLEYWHVFLLALVYIAIFSGYLYYRIQKLTTEEL